LGLSSWRFYDKDNAEAVTLTGQEIIKTSSRFVNAKFNKRCGTTDKDYVIYIDTDSVAGDSTINVNGTAGRKIEDVFADLFNDDVIEYHRIEDIAGHQFVFPNGLKLPYYDETDKTVKLGLVKYIEKHKCKKILYRITTASGKSVVVTEDHSCMVFRGDKLEKIFAKDVKIGDKVVTV
jgi:DNA polymerase elongation subunit (family B)